MTNLLPRITTIKFKVSYANLIILSCKYKKWFGYF